MVATCMPFAAASFLANILKIVRLKDPTNVSYLGILSVVAGACFLAWTWWKKDSRSFQTDRIV
jgi:hypothetical protein